MSIIDNLISSDCVIEFAIAQEGSDMGTLDWKPLGITAPKKRRKARLTKKINKRIMASYYENRNNK